MSNRERDMKDENLEDVLEQSIGDPKSLSPKRSARVVLWSLAGLTWMGLCAWFDLGHAPRILQDPPFRDSLTVVVLVHLLVALIAPAAWFILYALVVSVPRSLIAERPVARAEGYKYLYIGLGCFAAIAALSWILTKLSDDGRTYLLGGRICLVALVLAATGLGILVFRKRRAGIAALIYLLLFGIIGAAFYWVLSKRF